MNSPSSHSKFQERIVQAAEAVLKEKGSVGPLELLQRVGFLHPAHMERWRKGHEDYPVLETWFQVGPKKYQETLRHLQDWVGRRGLRPIEASYALRGPLGTQELRITKDGHPERETFLRTHYVQGDLPEKKTARLAAKLNRAPDLVVFQKVSEEGNCSECRVELLNGDLLFMERGQPLCLGCADLDHLTFLRAGDMALTRRAKQHSVLVAVVVRFNRARKRYERQGLLVSEEALTRAEQECAADASERAAARLRAAVVRQQEDREFIVALAARIQEQFPGCPAAEARRIADHTGVRSSGRVGRSAAGRQLDPTAVNLAVIAHIRHAHTNYDKLLMSGTDRLEARALVRDKIEELLDKWKVSCSDNSEV